MDRRVHKTAERYRIVGSTLILSTLDYVENAKLLKTSQYQDKAT